MKTRNYFKKEVFLFLVGLGALLTSGCAGLAYSAAALPVYNATFTPTAPNTKATFYNNQPTHVRFFIGLYDPGSAISAEKWTINPAILKRSDILPMVVTMNCLACSHDSIQKRVITYFPERESSSIAEFDFVPARELARANDGFAQVIFDVSSQGVQYDHIVVDTFIVDKASQIGDEQKGRDWIPFVPVSEQDDGKKPDLVLTLFREPDQSLKVLIQPTARWIENGLQQRHLNNNGELKTFDAGDLSEKEIDQLVSDSYFELRALVEPNNDALQSALAGKYSNQFRLVSNSEMSLQPSDRDKLLAKMYELGANLYSHIFEDGSPELREVLRIIEGISSPDPPIRIRIESNNIYLPWQLLHPVVSGGPYTHFWGLKYELSVNLLSSQRRGRLPGVLATGGRGGVLFAGYRGSGQSRDEVALLAAEQGKTTESRFGEAHVAIVNTTKEFLDKIVEKRQELEILLAYTHASSGTILFKTGAGLAPLTDVRGPSIIFEENDFVRPKDLYNLKIKFPRLDPYNGGPFLGGEPIVFLNACETGTKGVSPTTRLDFPGTFIELGARGVIATEAPVWKWFAYFFGRDIIDELAAGREVSKALFILRNKYMNLGNPLGLYYSYHGNPNARVLPVKKQPS